MRQKSRPARASAEQVVKDIRRSTRRHFSAEDKIRLVLEGLRGEDSIAELCCREGIVQNLYYRWSKEFLEAGKKRLAGDTARAYHTADIQFVFPKWHGGNLGVNLDQATGQPRELQGAEITLSDQITAAWTNFAKNGDPKWIGSSHVAGVHGELGALPCTGQHHDDRNRRTI